MTAPPPIPPQKTVRLEPDRRFMFKKIENSKEGGCHANVFLPATPKGSPIALMFHGGGFTIGDAYHIPPDQVRYFQEKGFTVVSAAYRLAPHVRFPEIREDLLDAYKWVVDGLSKELGEELDTSRICVMGWSAGGTSTVFATHDAMKTGLPKPKAIILTYSVAEHNKLWTEPISAFDNGVSEEEKKKIEELFKEPVSTEYSIQGDFWMQRNDPRVTWSMNMFRHKTLHTFLCNQDPPFSPEHAPIHLITPDFPPTFVVIATKDQLVPPEQSYSIIEKCKELGVEVGFGECEGMTHGIAEDGRETWPEGNEWWEKGILPGLEWAVKYTG